MDFSSLVLFRKDSATNMIAEELGSYAVSEGAEFITKMFYDGDKINIFFDTGRDVEEWEFTAIFDLLDEELFTSKGYEISQIDEEYNPTWLIKFGYSDKHEVVENTLKDICNLIEEALIRVLEDIKEKEAEYK